MSIIEIKPCFLYHTTVRHTALSSLFWKERQEELGIPIPPIGSYPTALNDTKFFTAHPEADYNSPWMPEASDYVFLKYRVKDDTVLRLLDCRSNDYSSNHRRLFEHIEQKNLENNVPIDGFIQIEDFVEICLLKPSKHLESFEEVDFTEESKQSGYTTVDIDRINKETTVLLRNIWMI